MSVPLSFGWRAQRTEMGREISGEGQKGVMCVCVCACEWCTCRGEREVVSGGNLSTLHTHGMVAQTALSSGHGGRVVGRMGPWDGAWWGEGLHSTLDNRASGGELDL